jgi:hypothetical protein
MATYGTRDATRFQVNGVQYYTLIESEGPNKGQITIKSPTVAGNVGGANADRTIGTIPLDNTFKLEPGYATTNEVAYFSSAAGQKAVKNHAVVTAQKAGAPNAQKLIFPNSATPDTPPSGSNPNQPPTPEGDQEGGTSQSVTQEQLKDINSELKKDYVEGTRKNYPDVRYPENLKLKSQDCIKFSILEYNSRGLSLKLEKNRRIPTGRKPLGTITLPIPAGINDRNNADWQNDALDPLTQGFADASMSFILGGTQSATSSVQSSTNAIGADTKSIEAFVAAKAAEKATGSNNLLARQFGAIINPNLELLFNGPQLRDFTFNFRFTPRTPKEAKNVRTIIRYFKQAMAPKRTASVLLLKTPHTFGIQYLSSNEEHPYLNKFKECALTNCAVNYTPDGTYMTYTDSSMTAYELSLTFQELEPIFDDDYGNEEKINSIGF